jgi:hypothetical protein
MEETLRKSINALEYFYNAEKGDAPRFYLNSCEKLLTSMLESINGSVPENVTEEINMAIEHVDYFRSNPIKYCNSPKYFYEHVGRFIGFILDL